MRKIGILVVLAASSFLSSYGFAACSKCARSHLSARRVDRASHAAVENVRWYPGRSLTNARQNRRSPAVHTTVGVESYPVPE